MEAGIYYLREANGNQTAEVGYMRLKPHENAVYIQPTKNITLPDTLVTFRVEPHRFCIDIHYPESANPPYITGETAGRTVLDLESTHMLGMREYLYRLPEQKRTILGSLVMPEAPQDRVSFIVLPQPLSTTK